MNTRRFSSGALVIGLVIGVMLMTPVIAESGQQTGVAQNNAALIRQLEQREMQDRGNAMSFSDSNNSLEPMYAMKADKLQALIDKLNRGQTVSQADVNEAMDNSWIKQLGGY